MLVTYLWISEQDKELISLSTSAASDIAALSEGFSKRHSFRYSPVIGRKKDQTTEERVAKFIEDNLMWKRAMNHSIYELNFVDVN